MSRFVALLAVLALVGGCGAPAHRAPPADPGTHFYYDAAGRLAAVRQGATTAMYRFDRAGNRVSVDHLRAFDAASLRPSTPPGPHVSGVTPKLVGQGTTVSVSGSGFDPDPMGNVVALGGALGRVVAASPRLLRVQLPPVAVPGPVTVSTAYGRSASKDSLVVVPAEVDPADVHDVVAVEIGKATSIDSGPTLLTFHGDVGSTVELHLESADSATTGCDAAAVGLSGPTGTIIEADTAGESWCDRPARLPMNGSYLATVSNAGAVRATIRASGRHSSPVPTPATRVDHPSATAGPLGFAVDLASGLMDVGVTDLALGEATDLTRSFSVGDPVLPASAPEEPLARHWSLAGSIAIAPSMSYSYLDLLMPDGRRLPFRRVTAGAPSPTGAVFEPSAGVGAGPFARSRVAYTGSGWELTTRTGSVLGFGLAGSPRRLSWVRDASGRTSRWVRAPDGGLVGVVADGGQWARFDRDAGGRITAATDQVGDRVTYHYGRPDRVYADVLTRVTYQRAGLAAADVGYRYQPITGRLAAVTDGRRDRIRFEYDEAGRVTRQRVLGPVPAQWRYSYDMGTRRVRIPGRAGSIRLPHIDRASVTGPGVRRTVSFRRSPPAVRSAPVAESPIPGYVERAGGGGVFVDARGRVAASRTADGAVTRLQYDDHDRPVSIANADDASTRFGYTRAGDLATITDAAGTTQYGWNASGQQISETDPLGHRQRWGYDRSGRLVWFRDARGIRTSFRYDRSGRLAGQGAWADPVKASYDSAGRRTSLTLPGGSRIGYGYDGKGRLSRMTLAGASVGASYDSKGRLAGLALPNGVRGHVSYRNGHAIGISYSRDGRQIASQSAEYDRRGRVSSLTGDLGRPELPAQQGRSTFDAAHQVTESPVGSRWRWDAAGNLLQDDSHRYSWDARGRLLEVSGPSGRTRYGYDALGRRTTSTSGGRTTRYVYDSNDVVQQVDAYGSRTSYLRGPDGTALASVSGGQVTALLPDLFGNVGAAVGADGAVRRYSYDPFGDTPHPSGGPGFRGLLSDGSGLLVMGARTYDPTSGRFLSRDTWGIEGGDVDPYRYALGAPTVYTDPTGHAAECVGMALGWAMSALGPGGGWDDYDALEDKADSGQISQDEWSVQADRISHDLWAGFDVVANVCGTSAVGSSAASLPLLGAGRGAGRLLGRMSDGAVVGAAATRVGSAFDGVAAGVSEASANTIQRLYWNHGMMPSRAVRFTQDSAGGSFKDGRLVLDLAHDMAETGRAPPELPPIRVFQQDGALYSLDNRRLFAGQFANVDLPYRWATQSEILSRRQTQIYGGTSISIRMPGGIGNWGWWQP
ncbi:RHS repeat-associated core domain-containing protein [Marmoricola sp. URHB0036]|uniref:RHS repeat-associated core domain-containing protein n=1 Tax=Marmoricola sp. URHB0036 TaxID=1298863 RepID=UPI000407FCEA|nr:RHS repeat-associated core domain-containing protein [Marmoricola sp. URHB0036]